MNYFRPVLNVDLTQLETIRKTEKIKHAHWISLDSEFLRFTPVLKPFLFALDGNSMENQAKEIEVVFKKIEPDPSE
jgi:hypothetical protein